MFRIASFTLGNRTVDLSDDQIVCFVGPNSAGKSSALRAVYNFSHGRPYGSGEGTDYTSSQISAASIRTIESKDKIKEKLLKKLHTTASSVRWFGANTALERGDFDRLLDIALSADPVGLHRFDQLFFYMVSAISRFHTISPTQHVLLTESGPITPLHLLYLDPVLEKKISDISVELFRKEIALNPGAGSSVTLHVGQRPDASKYGGDRTQAYANAVASLPSIMEEGDGLKSTIGLLCSLLGPDKEAFFVDEPDLYLHPPQAYSIAKVIAREKTQSQLFFATHSSRFLQGLAEHAAERVLIIRLEQNYGIYSFRIVDPDVFHKIRTSAILKFTNVIEAVFFQHAFVCEEAADCYLYSTLLERSGHTWSRDSSFWIGVNGKSNLPKSVKALKALAVEPYVICDFDILRERDVARDLFPLIEAQGKDPSEIQSYLEQRIYPQIRANEKLDWEQLKLLGLEAASPYSQIHSDLRKLVENLRTMRIIVNPFGEAESLRTPRHPMKGSEGINYILSLDLSADPTLRKAREFSDLVSDCVLQFS